MIHYKDGQNTKLYQLFIFNSQVNYQCDRALVKHLIKQLLHNITYLKQ